MTSHPATVARMMNAEAMSAPRFSPPFVKARIRRLAR
jgi:hypothetical protein